MLGRSSLSSVSAVKKSWNLSGKLLGGQVLVEALSTSCLWWWWWGWGWWWWWWWWWWWPAFGSVTPVVVSLLWYLVAVEVAITTDFPDPQKSRRISHVKLRRCTFLPRTLSFFFKFLFLFNFFFKRFFLSNSFNSFRWSSKTSNVWLDRRTL